MEKLNLIPLPSAAFLIGWLNGTTTVVRFKGSEQIKHSAPTSQSRANLVKHMGTPMGGDYLTSSGTTRDGGADDALLYYDLF